MEKKRFRLVFEAQTGYRRRTVYSNCTEDEIQACKEVWAMIIEHEIGKPVICIEITEQDHEK